jgi:SagB-type dehydrogenase family enzyme
MSNRNSDVAHLYHESTKLFYLDLQRKPSAYKRYRALRPLPLPTEVSPLAVSALEAVAATEPAASPAQALDLPTLAGLLFYAAGRIRTRTFVGAGEVAFRAAASAGGLYPIEVYVVCGDLPGLAAGVYHFSPADFALRCLRQGDYRGALAQAAAGDPTMAAAPVTLVFSAIFWRSAWKYRARSYRYCFWDNGTIVANVLAAATAAGLPARVLMGFIDAQVNHLLGLDGHREASTCLAPLGLPVGLRSLEDTDQVPPLSAEMDLSSREEIDYPEIARLHTASALTTPEEVLAWRGPRAGATASAHASVLRTHEGAALGATASAQGRQALPPYFGVSACEDRGRFAFFSSSFWHLHPWSNPSGFARRGT